MKISGLLSAAFLGAFAGLTVAAQTSPPKIQRLPLCNNIALSLPPPDFPQTDADAAGVVNVRTTIDEKGNVAAARAVGGDPRLRAAAERAALKAKFRVTTYRRKPVKVSCVIVYNLKRRAFVNGVLIYRLSEDGTRFNREWTGARGVAPAMSVKREKSLCLSSHERQRLFRADAFTASGPPLAPAGFSALQSIYRKCFLKKLTIL